MFSAQGRDPLSKKCKVTGSTSSVQKQYDKDVKSYVYILEGEPTTTKIQFPKEDKHGLFLTQKFLVFQLFVPVGRPFSFEIAVTDQTQNKRRIFFSSNLKDISVTPLHAKFPLTLLNAGSWLNMCLDLESLVSDTFSGPKFRAVESFTITANCRLKKVFTLRVPPLETSEGHQVQYANSEPLPRNLQLITTSDVSICTQVLSYVRLCGHDNPSTSVSTPPGNEGTTPRQDQETHIAFGTKVVIPPHLRRNSFKEKSETNKTQRLLSSSKTKQSDVRYANDSLVVKSPLSPKGNEDSPRGIDANQASIQPRPPSTSSSGKIRRPLRVKPSSAGKTRSAVNVDNNTNVDNITNVEKQPDSLETEKSPSSASTQKLTKEQKVEVLRSADQYVAMGRETSEVTNVERPVSQTPLEEQSKVLDGFETACPKNAELDERMKMISINASLRKSSETQKLTGEERLENGTGNDSVALSDALTTKTSTKNSEDVKLSLSGYTNEHSEIEEENSLENAEEKVNITNALDVTTSATKNADMSNNNNEPSMDKDSDQPRVRPRKLPLASNNPVFTFASMPRSPRSSKRKLLESPMVDDVITPNVEAAPEVLISLAETPVKNGPHSNRGASLEDDFCKLSDDENYDDEGGDGIQKLLQSSLSPRHSPMPFHQQLRQSIRSSMLKEIPSPVKENGYDAQNYQSDHGLDTLNQSTASSWRFDTSDSSNSFNQTQQDLEDSLNNTSFPKSLRHIAAVAGIPMVDDNDNEDAHSNCSDDSTLSTWRTPPQDLRGNKYQNEMKPLGKEPDLTATISMTDPRDYCDVFSPPIILGTPNKENNSAISNLSPMKSPNRFPYCGGSDEEELDLLYDPCLNCYFDPKTHKYYELA